MSIIQNLKSFCFINEYNTQLLLTIIGRFAIQQKDKKIIPIDWIDACRRNSNLAFDIAAGFGNLTIIKYALTQGADYNSSLAIKNAIKNGHFRVFNFLFDDCNIGINAFNNIAVGCAVEFNKIDILNFLISRKANINIFSDYGLPIVQSIKNKNYEIFNILIKNGANIHIVGDATFLLTIENDFIEGFIHFIKLGQNIRGNFNGATVYNIAVTNKATQIIKCLTSHYFMVFEIDIYRYFLQLLKNFSVSSYDMVKFLVENGVNPGFENNYVMRQITKRYSTGCCTSKNYILLAELFINTGCDLSEFNDTLSLCYSKENHHDKLKLLIKTGKIKIDMHDNIIFENACRAKNVKFIKWLIINGVKVDVASNALNVALELKDYKFIKWLVKKGVNIYAYNNYIISMLYIHNYETIDWLISRKIDITVGRDRALIILTRAGDLKTIKKLVSQGADVYVQNNKALRSAAKHLKWDIVVWLVENGADLHVKNNYVLRRLIFWKCFINIKITKWLIKNKYNGVGIDKLFRYAVKVNNFEIADLLLKNGADINADKGKVLISALEYEPEKQFEWLISKGLDVRYRITDALWLYVRNYGCVEIKKQKSPKKMIMQLKKACKWFIDHGAIINETPKFDHIYDVSPKVSMGDLSIITKLLKYENYELADYLIKCGANINYVLFDLYRRKKSKKCKETDPDEYYLLNCNTKWLKKHNKIKYDRHGHFIELTVIKKVKLLLDSDYD